MTTLRHISRQILLSKTFSGPFLCSKRLLNYTAINYEGDKDPTPLFFNENIQSLLRSLTRVDYSKVFRRRKLGKKHLDDPEYKFMTDEELQAAFDEAKQVANELLQIPPVVKVRNPITKVLSKDPALQGLETSNLVFTDITFGVDDADRLIVVRDTEGTLKEADWELRQRMNQVYFPIEGRVLKRPSMFDDQYLENLLERNEYEFILDKACIQFEPDDPDYQRITSITYQHVNDKNNFDLLRSSRHFGALTFFLVWNKNIDNLLLELLETLNATEALNLVSLYSTVHEIKLVGASDIELIEDFVKKAANKKGALELAIQSYKEVSKEKAELAKGIKAAHGIVE